ncbi:MAG: glycine cleavage system protein GcvH [Cellulomonas sp.]|uniref:Glycine cleavage system H protein n=1 Tax=Cellulomonas gelida TaxID=1712 RepID=A0A4Y3KJQ8_9CELL|nr:MULTISPECIES: glycine cleavage system protein GcvH [Cellulomonas]KMM44410.1 glycine cleavage system protein H [Cellulomonas sp. A375-1]MCR6649258.1 glycine cleavage system protein GcvH [Cellulomonas sp.]MCR6705244.1 glycine cleavage system protein GcvH [Cellulomonas sp.]GEA84133.1 glycine cleavage system H protein [Cellulomonas gelida]GGL19853.1 glycine cleavage system H protein [Cellulomonas gelida]
MTDLPADLKYTLEHEWLTDGSPATVGITSVAAEALGDIVYLELPAVGESIDAGTVIGEIESTKSVSELFSPVSGTVVEVNTAAVDDPSVVNADPFGAGWLLKVEVTTAGPLLTAEEYAAHAAG